MSEDKLDSFASGILYDFMGWLTTRDEKLILSRAHECGPAIDVIQEFLTMRGVDQKCEADVKYWDKRCSMLRDTTLLNEDGWISVDRSTPIPGDKVMWVTVGGKKEPLLAMYCYGSWHYLINPNAAVGGKVLAYKPVEKPVVYKKETEIKLEEGWISGDINPDNFTFAEVRIEGIDDATYLAHYCSDVWTYATSLGTISAKVVAYKPLHCEGEYIGLYGG